MNGLPGDVILFGVEVRDVETPDGRDRDRKRLRRLLRSGGLPQMALRFPQRAQDLSTVEPLPLTVFAKAHRDVLSLRAYATTPARRRQQPGAGWGRS
jgi:hypothetical protein